MKGKHGKHGDGRREDNSASEGLAPGAQAGLRERPPEADGRVPARQARRQRRERRRRAYLSYVDHKIHSKPVVAGVYTVLRLLVLAEIVRSLVLGRAYNVFMCAVVLLLLMVPSLMERRLLIELPSVLEVIVLLFVFAAEFLGEIDAFYVRFPWWDTMLHTLWGFLCAGVGFALVDFLNRSQMTTIRLTPLYMAVSAVAFSVAVGTVWEIFEYSVDNLLGMDMQKDELVTSFGSVWLDPDASNAVVSVRDIAQTTITLASGETIVIEGGYLDIGIHDTMADIIVNFIGAVVFALFGYAYVKTRGKNRFVASLIPRVLPLTAEGEVDEEALAVGRGAPVAASAGAGPPDAGPPDAAAGMAAEERNGYKNA